MLNIKYIKETTLLITFSHKMKYLTKLNPKQLKNTRKLEHKIKMEQNLAEFHSLTEKRNGEGVFSANNSANFRQCHD